MIDEYKISRFFAVIVSLGLVAIGVSVVWDPIFVARNYGMRINFGTYHKVIGSAIVLAGVLLFYFSVAKSTKK